MKLVVNDREYETEQASIEGFLRERGIEPRLIVIEHNGAILRREEWDGVVLADGDVMQMAHMVAGG